MMHLLILVPHFAFLVPLFAGKVQGLCVDKFSHAFHVLFGTFDTGVSFHHLVWFT